jgi:hypothetical protein
LVSSTSFDLGVGDDHVILAEADAGLERVAEAQRHDGVGEQHRVLLAGVAIDLSITSPISFLVSRRLMISNGTLWLLGRHSPISMRPGVVSKRFM